MHKTMYEHTREELENLFNIYYKSSVTGEELDIEADTGIMNYIQVTEMLLCLGLGIDTAYNSNLQTIAKRGISKYTQILKKHYNLNIRQFVLDVQNLNV